jgi:hypothetical protein
MPQIGDFFVHPGLKDFGPITAVKNNNGVLTIRADLACLGKSARFEMEGYVRLGRTPSVCTARCDDLSQGSLRRESYCH